MYSKLTKYSKHEFRQAHRKIIDVLNSCDNEAQFVSATRMCDGFRRWIEFWKSKWRRALMRRPWELFNYLDWVEETDMLIDDINAIVQQFYDFIEQKHKEEEQDDDSPRYPKPVVIRGFADPEPKKRKKKHE